MKLRAPLLKLRYAARKVAHLVLTLSTKTRCKFRATVLALRKKASE